MERIWLKSYLPGMAADIDPSTLPSLKHMAEQSFVTFRDRAAYLQMGHRLTYGELDRSSRDLAAWLQNVAGLKRAIAWPSCCPMFCNTRSRCLRRCAWASPS
jgi:long-chain acyl-CoA synthetase